MMGTACLAAHPGVVGCAPSLTHLGVRSLRCSPPPSAELAMRAASLDTERAAPRDVDEGADRSTS